MNNISHNIIVNSYTIHNNKIVLNVNYLDELPDTNSHYFKWLIEKYLTNTHSNFTIDGIVDLKENTIEIPVKEKSDMEYFIENNLQ